MPDADDFDVEYFRNLLKGNTPKETPEAPAGSPPPLAKKNARRTAKPTTTTATTRPAASRKKSTGR